MASPTLSEAVNMLVTELDGAIEKDDFIEKPLNCLLLGGYALRYHISECESPDMAEELARDSDDIDVYAPDAVLLADKYPISFTGLCVDLGDNFGADLANTISGMDRKEIVEKMHAGMSGEFDELYKGDNVVIRVVSPELFVTNKLLSYRRRPSERFKDLYDIGALVLVLDDETRESVEDAVREHGVEAEYQLVLDNYFN
jgi:hypothetical protein